MDVIRCRTCSTPLLPTASFCGTCGDTISSDDNLLDSPTMHTASSKLTEEQYATVPAASVQSQSQEPGLVADRPASPEEDSRDEYATISTEVPVDADAVEPEEGEIASKDTTLLNALTKEQDAIAVQHTVPLKEDRDETDFLPLIPLPGQFTAAPAPERAEHKQPEMQRAEHKQIQNQRAEHFQVHSPRARHVQPGMLVQSGRGKPAASTQNILIALGVVIVAVVIVLSALPIFHPSAVIGPRLVLINASSAFPGGSVHLHGTNFTPGAAVSISLDETASSTVEALPSTQASIGLGIALLSTQQLQYSADTIVQKDGTFDATISIPSDWQVNTTHDIQAIEQGSGQKAVTKVTVVDRAAPSLPISLPTPGTTPGTNPRATAGATSVQNPTATTDANPIAQPTQGPPPPTSIATTPPACIKIDNAAFTFNAAVGGAAPGAQTFTLSNGTGCSAGNWTLTSDSAWLTTDKNSGTIAAGGSTPIAISVSTANLNGGTHTGHIHLGTNTITVTLNIQLAPTCITATTTTLNFSAPSGGTAASQTATIANGATCSAGTWSVASDANWLLVNGGGRIGTGGSANATVNISTTGLAAGNRTGHLTFSANGSHPATVTVNLTIQVPPCLTANQGALTFSGDVGFNSRNPGPQRVIVTNCGRAGNITATNGGASWLTVTGGGQVNAGGQTVFEVQATCVKADGSLLLPAVANTYTTTITFTITAADGTKADYPVTVTFNVTKSVVTLR